MRFLPDGPRIPDELLEARDNGDVVFLCGAGISLTAGLPSFAKLADQVIEKVGAPKDAPSRLLLDEIQKSTGISAPLDQVFQHLKYEYGAEHVDEVVAGLLDPAPDVTTDQHAIILRLSRSAVQQSQIVTTNFDLLFERVDPSLKRHIAPVLPDLTDGRPLEGIVYLHGRLNEKVAPSSNPPPLILSSADFGRAYLAEGWATEFMVGLLRHQTIVLVGYSATDPPVRYLLEGIHSRDEDRPARIYAFDQGAEDLVHSRWRDRGVRGIAYGDSQPKHAQLWDTLRAWADRTDDLDAWRESVVALAAHRPSQLKPYQRGQVASVVRTEAGAKLFRDSKTPPPAEWLCVFDRNIRYSEPHPLANDNEKFDPLEHYGLDDDPPRPSKEDSKEIYTPDLIRARITEHGSSQQMIRLAGSRLTHSVSMSSRLFHLAHWLVRLLNDPALAWWAARYQALHPRLVSLIEWKIENSEIPLHERAYRMWMILLEKERQFARDDFGGPWFPFVRLQKRDGWAPHVLRELERIIRPYFTSAQAVSRPSPPSASWEALELRDVARLDVKFLEWDTTNVPIPTEALPGVFRILRRGLENAVDMLVEIDHTYWKTATFIPEEAEGERYLNSFDAHLQRIVRLFDRLAAEYPELARDEVKYWPQQSPFIFNKLRLYAWRHQTLISGIDVAAGILALPDASFWHFDHRRELLHALASRWNDMDAPSRERIESRIIAGPPVVNEGTDQDRQRYMARTVARTLGWLVSHGCVLSEQAANILAKLRAGEPQWQPAWDQHSDASGDIRVRSLQVDTDPAGLLTAPIRELIPRATELSKREHWLPTQADPFRGVVERRPRRAVLALAYEAHRKHYPAAFWRTLLQALPDEMPQRLRWSAAARLVRLPTETVAEVLAAATHWFLKHLPVLAETTPDRALRLWEALLEHVLAGGEKENESHVETLFGRDLPRRSRRTYADAINSPVGSLTRALLDILSDRNAAPGAGIPGAIRQRMERLLSLSGTWKDYSLSEMTSRLTGLHQLDPEWVQQHLLPLFDPRNPDTEPAWSGYAWDRWLPSPDLFALLKPSFLEVFAWMFKWQWDDDALRHFIEVLLLCCQIHQKSGGYLTYAETRTILQQTTGVGRSHAAWKLERLVKEEGIWQSFGKPFIEKAWPRERRFQTSGTSGRLADLARATPEEFPDAARTVLPFLVALDHPEMFLHDAPEDTVIPKLHQRFPEPYLAMLDHLIARDASSPPYGLAEIVRDLVQAEPRLRQDPRWRRLNELITRG